MQVPMNLIKIPSDWPQIYVLTMQPFSVQVHKPLHALSFYTVTSYTAHLYKGQRCAIHLSILLYCRHRTCCS